jgi:hypothetical protein
MLVRVRWSTSKSSTVLKHQLALAVGSLLTPLALLSFTVSFWGFAAEFRWASGFFITAGMFSHWQVWLALAGVFLLLARLLGTYGSSKETLVG